MKKEDLKNMSVSWGTLNEEDLAKVFLNAMDAINPSKARVLREEYEKIIESGDEEELYFFINEDLFDALNDEAPEGYYFGAHPGDGSDFGFWEYEDL